MPTSKARAKPSNDACDVTLLSNSQITKGSSTNISKPLTRCMIETIPAGGSRYLMICVTWMLRISGRLVM